MKKIWSGKSILLVEDNEPLLNTLKTFFLQTECKVYSAFNGAEALNILNVESIDIVISDIQMPVMDGMDLLKNIRQKNSNIPVVLLSTGHSHITVNDVLLAGAFDLLHKPYSLKALSEILGRMFQV